MLLRRPGVATCIGYSTNVHPGETAAELTRMLRTDVAQVRDALAELPSEQTQHLADTSTSRLSDAPAPRRPDSPTPRPDPFGVELRLSTPSVHDLQAPAARDALKQTLAESNLFLFSINAFPLSPFHANVVKDAVYRPDWSQNERIDSTLGAARLLAECLPADLAGTVSTSPGGFKPWGNVSAQLDALADGLARIALELSRLQQETGKRIAVAVEPEPFCALETCSEAAEFWRNRLPRIALPVLKRAGLSDAQAQDALQRHVGLNLDACHLAVEFESPAEALALLQSAGAPVAKLHVSAAARVRDPSQNAEGMNRLAELAEPRYLHQTFAVDSDRRVVFRGTDLPELLALPTERLAEFAEIRTHFHMPLFADPAAPLGTTSDVAADLLARVLRAGEGTPLVVETYTWSVLPEAQRGDVHAGIAHELAWLLERVEQI